MTLNTFGINTETKDASSINPEFFGHDPTLLNIETQRNLFWGSICLVEV